ncbi:MAG TPA: hypothetical protein PKA30_16170, partial [Accumulibacter sp.]|uniref:hypothetical protein n=2 Tax=Accumulibacter sp. TaxID=2053492 RepID=UPI002CC51409
MLSAYHAGLLHDSIAYAKELADAQLDDTPDSLQRIDHLLRQVHAQLKPRLASFADSPANGQFLMLLADYIGPVIARFTLQRVEWYRPEELAPVLPAAAQEKIEACFQTSIRCTFLRNGEVSGLFLPLAPSHDILFAGDSTVSLAASGDRILRRCLSSPVLHAPSPALLAPGFAADQTASVAVALHRRGLLVGAQTALDCRTTLEHGSALEPRITEEYANGQRRRGRHDYRATLGASRPSQRRRGSASPHSSPRSNRDASPHSNPHSRPTPSWRTCVRPTMPKKASSGFASRRMSVPAARGRRRQSAAAP